jgi:membrane-associated phospholipid phosphatase
MARWSRRLAFAAIGLLALPGAALAATDVVLEWNTVLLDAIRADRTNPPRAARAMAAMHVAVFDAVDGVLGGFTPFAVASEAAPGASPEAAAAAAAHLVLSELFPAQRAVFDAALEATLAGVPDGAAETSGLAWGAEVAEAILERCRHDRSDQVLAYEHGIGGGWWAPTPPAFGPALLPQWGRIQPWTLGSGRQLRPAGPPSTRSREYFNAFREVRLLGAADSLVRTAEQTQIALFWADGAGTATPPGHWLAIAAGIARERTLTLAENARLFALLSLAMADAAVVAWDAKYEYDFWRPYTAILHADQDGNPDTRSDAGWQPLVVTPPFPAYTSGHSTFSSAAARVLGLFLGSDAVPFSTTSDGLAGVTRSFPGFWAAAEEAGQSRIYGGIHWQFDNQQGLAAGRALGEHVFYTQLQPRSPVESCADGETAACVHGRFLVEVEWRTADGSQGSAIPLAVGGGGGAGAQFAFFSPDNPEVFVKVLDGCAVNEAHWVFVSGLTNVEVLVTVTDTATGNVRRAFSPQGRPFAPVQDLGAFACP